jgi:hypothetical protein
MSTLMTALVASSGNNAPIFTVVMLIIGALLFIFGFLKYRQYRILADTPVVPIRSVSMGLSHVAGTSTGGQPLVSPLTQVPCYYYEVRVEKKVKHNDEEKWEETHKERADMPFYLQDQTGSILVNPASAEYNLPQAFCGEVRPPGLLSIGHPPRKIDPSLGVPPPTEEHLRSYLNGGYNQARAALQGSNIPGAKAMDKGLAVAQKMELLGVSIGSGGIRMDFGNQVFRLTEYCLPAGKPTNVLGTCTENPNPVNAEDGNLIKKGENEKTYLISTKTEEKLEKSLKLQALFMILIGGLLIIGGAALGLHSAHLI